MKVIPTSLVGCFIIQPQVYGDERGYFFESYNKEEFVNELGIDIDFVQDNQSMSKRGVLRGLHFQIPPFAQAKLVRVVSGEVLDIAVDLRKKSPTYGKYESFMLSEYNKLQLFVPRGFAHGFVTLSEQAVFFYKCDNYYAPDYERGIKYDDPALNINWKIDKQQIELSKKDENLPLFNHFKTPF